MRYFYFLHKQVFSENFWKMSWGGITQFPRWILEFFLFRNAADPENVVHFGKFERTTTAPLARNFFASSSAILR